MSEASQPVTEPRTMDADFAEEVFAQLREEIRSLKNVPGRVIGLREAAGLVRAACNKEVTARFMVGKKENAARAMNNKLLMVTANLIEQYAADAEKGKV